LKSSDMGKSEVRVSDDERRVIRLVGWRRRLYSSSLPVMVAAAAVDVLSLETTR
jgi:hypothetical protein